MKSFITKKDKSSRSSCQIPASAAGEGKTKSGFTLVEVTLVLGIAGLMMIGLIGGTFTAIARQRYNDSVYDFADFLERAYSEAASPKTVGSGNSDEIILGKVLVFGYDYGNADADRSVYTATLIGNNDSLNSLDPNATFMEELVDEDTAARLYCGSSSASGEEIQSSVQYYTPLWQDELKQATDTPKYDDGSYTAEYDKEFKGTIIIARTPSSAVVHTVYAPNKTYNLRDDCTPTNHNVNTPFQKDLEEQRIWGGVYHINKPVGFCIKSDNSAVTREIRLAADGRNNSAIWVRNTDASEDGDPNRCQR